MCYKNPGYICEVIKADTVCSQGKGPVFKFDRKKRDLQSDTTFDVVSFNFTFKLDPYFHKDSRVCDDKLCREKYETLLEVRSIIKG